MPSSNLYAINCDGRVFSLSTSGSMWKEFMYLGLEFKQLSAVPHFMWAIGGDRQVYVHVHGLDIPIRIKEETYENERWLPLEGFSGRLLPTDRYHFSNHDGSVDRSRDKVKLPSMAWQWEGDWQIETTLDGQPLDHDGWTYAVDFPATYGVTKQWKSCVRRRKWVRYRRYSAMNSWCAIAPLHKDATKEPFIDVSIGGNQIPGGNPGDLTVWAVTAHGRVMFRVGVSTTSPEGLRWSAIKMNPGDESLQISVGVTGLVWVTLLNGKALVRTGVSRENPMGDEWAVVEPPQPHLRLTQVSVGLDAVWAITHEGSVWFRKGIKGEMSGICEQLAVGTGWVEMSTKMILVSVAPNDQVWAIGHEDRCLYYRSGIARSELTGKKWKAINAPFQLSRANSSASMSSNSKYSLCGTPNQKSQTFGSLQNQKTLCSNENVIKEWEEQSRSAPGPVSLKNFENHELPENTIQQSIKKKMYYSLSTNSTGSQESNEIDCNSVANITISNETLNKSGESIFVTGKGMGSTVKINPGSWSPVHSVGSMVGAEVHPETDGSIFDPDFTGDSSVFGEDESAAAIYWAEYEMTWVKVEAGACLVDLNNPPKWLVETNGSNQVEIIEEWRINILNELKNRLKGIDFDVDLCEKAIEKSSWVKNGEAKCKLKGTSLFEDCIVELEWISSDAGTLDFGTLTILNTDGVTTMVQFSISEVVCIVCCSEPGLPRLAIYTPRLNNCKTLRLQFSSDTELEDWMAHLTSVSCKINNAYGRPSSKAIWATTALGDVYVHDPVLTEENQYANGIYIQELNTANKALPFESILQNGFSPGCSLHVTVCIHDDADRISLNLVCHSTTVNKYKQIVDTNDVALHFNPRLSENIIVRNTYQNNNWGDEERNGDSPIKAGSNFSLVLNCEERGYRIFINDTEFTFYNHRINPKNVTHLRIKGKMTLSSVLYKSPSVIIEPTSMFWRQIGGHLKKVETCNANVTWGIGYDNTAWVYTGGWGGLDFGSSGVNTMIDTHNYFVYENQRWNPITGFTSHGLPTDRYMWSDASGRQKRTRENTKLLSCHWQWVSEWILDFHTPGGVDRDGWQYATDFPSQYHGKKQFTDYVRRRRWFRRCQLTTSGPWKELGNTKLVDVSLYNQNNADSECPIHVWAVAPNGEALFRRGVSESCPMGVTWEHIPSDQPLVSISIGPNHQVWAIGKNGSSYWRFGISESKPTGESWQNVEPPSGSHLKQIAVNENAVWVLDDSGKLSVRREIQPKVFPEGTHWQTLPAMTNDPIHIGDITEFSIPSTIRNFPSELLRYVSVLNTKQGFRHISVGLMSNQVWAVSGAGIVCRRIGITDSNPAGSGWATGIGANWQQISVGGLVNDLR
uniref:Galectin domain-containing protein n=1 Tax=Trichogramma kaykai TaxID=54128 RepID=A0ABD2WY66_9HYME